MTSIPIRYTRNLFLRAVCVVYLFAFVSFYIQIPGLYGDNGILPAKALLENSKHKTLSAKVHYQPTLLWLAPYLGLDTNYALDLLALFGSFLAFTGFVSQKFCTIPLFAGLWSLYFSLYQIGQVFVTSQWDDLLLEVGFLSLLVAPLLPGRTRGSKVSHTDTLSFFLVKWLLFRFLVSAAIVKLQSGCDKWWSLTALNYHFESMVLPSPLSWYAHHIPEWYLKLTTVFTNVCELLLPLLFFVPTRSVRITGFVFQMFLQICIVLTGNFNFVNLLMVTMLLSLLDDQFFFGKSKKAQSDLGSSVLSGFLNVAMHGTLFFGVYTMYNLKLNGYKIESEIAFTKVEFDSFVRYGILASVYIAMVSIGVIVIRALTSCFFDHGRIVSKIGAFASMIFYTLLATTLFTGSMVPMYKLHKSTNATISSRDLIIYNRLHKLHVVNEYGLFSKMSGGDNGRPEIIVEGANNLEGPWLEYNFLYKPGNLNHSLPFVAPYSPRLDWQFWFAATSKYEKEPWLLSLIHRLLEGRPEVLSLLGGNPFGDKPPKYIRGVLYNYKFTPWSQRSTPAYWTRQKVGEYFPAYTKESPFLVDYLKARNLLPTASKQPVNDVWKNILSSIRYVTSHLEATLLLWSIFTAGCAMITTTTKIK